MANAPASYNSEKVVTGDVEYPATDPASGAFFQPDFKKNDDLKMMLDSSKDSLKLEAMKRIIGMIAKGRDASDLFPAVVKNVVSKNIEVKKLVYVYLARYAEEQQDLALLSISTFQRALKDPNQLIRASALRVLSSIRVSMIVPIVMLAIRDSASDMSPYVRKTAAHAIPKLYSLDAEQKEDLVAIISKLLSDKAPLVVGSAAMAFTEVCAESLAMLHPCYRKLCLLLADVDEWGQCALLNVLTVYARTYFPDPNVQDNHSSDSEGERSSDSDAILGEGAKREAQVDPDLRLLLRAARPLLQSRSAAVVMCVASLYYHCAPVQELPPVVKTMIRLLRGPREVQSVVLNSIASLTVTKKALFEPYLKSFFVRMSDPLHIKLLKVEIISALCSSSNASLVLKELQTYVRGSERALAAAAIQALGRAALTVESETQSCLNASLQLLSSKHEWAVCEAVLVVKRVVSAGAASARQGVARAARLLLTDRLAARGRGAGVWLLAEHGAEHARAAAVLAHMTNTFAEQEELVKLQLLNLAAKLSITQPDTRPLAGYILQLARYDVSYDVRDRARMFSKLLGEDNEEWTEAKRQKAARVLLVKKPAPKCDSQFQDRQQFTLGTLSHYLGSACTGYSRLPVPPAAAIDAALRDDQTNNVPEKKTRDKKDKIFYSEPNSSGSGDSSSSDSSTDSSDSEDSGPDEQSDAEVKKEIKPEENNVSRSWSSGSADSESDSESDNESDSAPSTGDDTSAQTSDEENQKPPRNAHDLKSNAEPPSQPSRSNLELLLELDSVASHLPTLTPTAGGFFTPTPGQGSRQLDAGDDLITPCSASFTSPAFAELLSRVTCRGLAATQRWTRAPHLAGDSLVPVAITITNHSSEPVLHLRVNKKTLTGTRSICDFQPIPTLEPGASQTVTLGVNFADTIQPIDFTIACSLGEFPATITPPVGELMRCVTMSETRWDIEQKKLRGMNECDKKASKELIEEKAICQRVFETANLSAITSSGELLRFAGQMMYSKDLVLLSAKLEEDHILVRANCPNMAIASMLANQVAQALGRV